MNVALIAAMDDERGIGIDNHLPWHLATDYKLFKSITSGHHIVMGRLTFESLGKPLPNRPHIVISRAAAYPLPEGCFLVSSLDEGLKLAEQRGEKEAFVIGGAQVYTQALPLAQRLYLTRVHAVCRVDAYFPQVNWDEWVLCKAVDHPADDRNDYAFTFQVWERK